MFSLPTFLERCQRAAQGPRAQDAVAAVLRQALAQHGIWEACRGLDADHRGVARVHVGPHLTVVHVNLAPGFRSRVHDHGLWAAIGVYAGQEDNVLYAHRGGRVASTGAVTVRAPDVFCMGARAIHHIENRLDKPLRALHCYGGDLESARRASYNLATGAVVPEGGAAG